MNKLLTHTHTNTYTLSTAMKLVAQTFFGLDCEPPCDYKHPLACKLIHDPSNVIERTGTEAVPLRTTLTYDANNKVCKQY